MEQTYSLHHFYYLAERVRYRRLIKFKRLNPRMWQTLITHDKLKHGFPHKYDGICHGNTGRIRLDLIEPLLAPIRHRLLNGVPNWLDIDFRYAELTVVRSTIKMHWVLRSLDGAKIVQPHERGFPTEITCHRTTYPLGNYSKNYRCKWLRTKGERVTAQQAIDQLAKQAKV